MKSVGIPPPDDADDIERTETTEGIRRGLEASNAGRVRPTQEVFADMQATIEGVRRGEAAAAAGRERPLVEFIAEQRIKHNFPADWPHRPEEER